MRATAGDTLSVFNGADGEWRVRIEALDKKRGVLRAEELQRAQPDAPSPSLYFAVLKGARLPALVEKATELGVGELQPVVTRHCAARDLNGAAESRGDRGCRAVRAAHRRRFASLSRCLKCWPAGTPKRRSLCATSAATARRPWNRRRAAGRAILVGPEGGFSPEEFEALDALAAARARLARRQHPARRDGGARRARRRSVR